MPRFGFIALATAITALAAPVFAKTDYVFYESSDCTGFVYATKTSGLHDCAQLPSGVQGMAVYTGGELQEFIYIRDPSLYAQCESGDYSGGYTPFFGQSTGDGEPYCATATGGGMIVRVH